MTSDIIKHKKNDLFFFIIGFISLVSTDFYWLFLRKCKKMIHIKNEQAIKKMIETGRRLSIVFKHLQNIISEGISTLEIDAWIENALQEHQLKTTMKGYHGYKHVSCISI